jgi:hypothetical protein
MIIFSARGEEHGVPPVPGCGERTELHPPAPPEQTIWASDVDRLARLPFRASV